jgi:oligopeptide transport system substrate-binding protein
MRFLTRRLRSFARAEPRSLLFLAILGLSSGAMGSPVSKTFSFRLPGEPSTLDWNRATSWIETYVITNLMEGLVTVDSRLKVQPALARSWSISRDGMTYVFHLRPGVKWSDGVTLSARDFVYSWQRLLLATTACRYAYFLFDIQGAEDFNKGKLRDFSKVGIQAVDDLTLKVTLRHPVAHWLNIPSLWLTFPARADVIEKYGTSWTGPGRIVTLGPFLLSSLDQGSRIVLAANPGYYGKHGNVGQVVAEIIKSDEDALKRYDAGYLQFVDVGKLSLERVRKRSDLRVFRLLETSYLSLVATKFPMTSRNLRRAIAMAIDRSRLGLKLPGFQPAGSLIPPGMLAHSPRLGLPFDPAKAKVELQDSGLDLSRSINLQLLVPEWENELGVAQQLQSELKRNLGINLSFELLGATGYRTLRDSRAFALAFSQWQADYPDPDSFMSAFVGDAGQNKLGWNDPRYDEKVLKARIERNPKTREKLYLEAQKILLEEDAVVLPLFHEPKLTLLKPGVKGVELTPLGQLYLRTLEVK